MHAPTPIRLSPADKLDVLRRLDHFRRWDSLDEKRRCLECGKTITGRQIEVVGGTRGLGPLRLQCPTENCSSIPMDWALPGQADELKASPQPRELRQTSARDGSQQRKIPARLREFISVLKRRAA